MSTSHPDPAVREETRRKRDTEMGRLRGQIKRERAIGRMAKRHAMDCDARQAEAEAAQARAEANLAKLKAKHLRAVAEHKHEIDSLTDRAEKAEAAIERVRAIKRSPGIRSASEFVNGQDDGWDQALTAILAALDGTCSLCGGTGIVPGTEEPEINASGEPCDCRVRAS